MIYGYVRVSTANQADGESLQVQARQLDGWAMMRGVKLDQTFVEAGVSGSVPFRDRPEGKVLWDKLRRGDQVVAPKLDRMFRDARDALNTVGEFQDRGIEFFMLDLGTEPVTNGMAKLLLTVLAAFAEAERDRIRERITTAKRDQKARGRYLGGIPPFGYRRGEDDALIPMPEEQAVIAMAREMRGHGRSYRQIIAAAEHDHGRKLSLSTVGKILEGAKP